MSRKVLIPILIAALVVAAVVVGALASRARGDTSLPAISAPQLLTNVATKAHDTTSISGNVSWQNDLLGNTSGLNLGGATTPTGLSSLLQGGSGRIWLQGGKTRLESQGQNGDFVVTAANGTVWTYSSATNTATEYTLPAGSSTGSTPSPSPSALDPTTQIEQALQKLAPTATVAVTGQESVGGQQAYILTLTPKDANTTLGSVQVAIDGSTYVPLRIEVFAKGSTTAALSAGFTSVSYAKIDNSLFEFTPPAGATVVHKQVDLPTAPATQKEGTQKSATEVQPLTLSQVQAQVPFTLMLPHDSTLPFSGGFVIPAQQTTATSGSGTGSGPTAVLHYGTGFGSVVLVETQTTSAQLSQLQTQLAQLSKVQLAQPTTVNGDPGLQLSTSLFNVIMWQHGKLTVAAAGMVPQSELSAFANSVR
jgi:outer membrane lipoprotein-sorting protein